jgi:hypothetical protein
VTSVTTSFEPAVNGDVYSKPMASSSLRTLAYQYVHFAGRHLGPVVNRDLLSSAILLICLLIFFVQIAGIVKSKKFLGSRSLFAVTLVLAVVWARLPWLLKGQINVDEGMFLATAHKLAVFDPVFWRSVDGFTSGPINYYAVLLPRIVGLPWDFATAHLMNALCLGGSLVFLYLCARTILPEADARVAVLPALAAVMGFHQPELLFYSSECVPVLLMACAAWLLLLSFKGAPTRWTFLVLGAIIICLPLAKLQTAPAAVLLAVLTGALGFARLSQTGWQPLIFFAAGGAGVLIFLISALARFGQFPLFETSFIENNLDYVNTALVPAWTLESFWQYFTGTTEITVFMSAASAYFIYSLLACRHRRESLTLWLAGLAFLSISVYLVYRPMRPFPHYLLFLVVPLGLMIVISHSSLLALQQPASRGTPDGKASAILLFMAFLAPLYWNPGFTRADMEALLNIPAVPECGVCGALSKYAKRGDLVSIWGWAPEVYVMTETIFSTHESFTEHQMVPYARLDYYRQRYLDDLKRSPPAVFLDAVGPQQFVSDTARYGLHSWPALESLIASQYKLAEEVDGCRIYLHNSGPH